MSKPKKKGIMVTVKRDGPTRADETCLVTIPTARGTYVCYRSLVAAGMRPLSLGASRKVRVIIEAP